MNDEDIQVRSAIRSIAREASLAEPLNLELLVAYYNDQLSQEDKERVRDHLLACAEDRELLRELARFPEVPGKPEVSEREIDAAWTAVRSRVAPAQEIEAISTQRETVGASLPWLPWRSWRVFALPAGLAALSLGLSLWVWDLRHTVAEMSEPQPNAMIADFHPETDPLRMAPFSAPQLLKLSPSTSQLVVILHGLPTNLPRAAVRILDSQGREIWQSSALEVSAEATVTLSLYRSFLAPGDYRIAVTSASDNRHRVLLQYRLSVRLQ